MSKKRSWNNADLIKKVEESKSFRQVLKKLNLKPAGGNYEQIKKYITELKLDTKHFTGRGWNKGLKGINRPRIATKEILIKGSNFQSYKLKKRLFDENIKNRRCEECGWNKKTVDGYLPLELHHTNGDRHDNRIENLQVLCPNCHSLKPNYRGRNKKTA